MATVAALEAAVSDLPITSIIEEEPEDASTPRASTPRSRPPSARPPSAARSRPASAASDKPTPVFAPRPVRLPPVIYRPIPLRRPMLVVEDTSSPATPPPQGVVASLARAVSASPGVKGEGVHRRRRSSSASLGGDGGWNFKSVIVTEPRLQGADTEVQVRINEEVEEDSDMQPVQIYSPSKDVLDELYKIMRNDNHTTTFSPVPGVIPRTPSTSSLSQFPFNPIHRRHPSDASAGTRTPPTSRDGTDIPPRIPFPSSPVSRMLTRNPIIFNQQFKSEKE